MQPHQILNTTQSVIRAREGMSKSFVSEPAVADEMVICSTLHKDANKAALGIALYSV